MKYLLDTNVLSELTKPSPNPGVMAGLGEHRVECATCSVVAFELLYGIALLPQGARRAQLQAQTAPWFAGTGGIPVLPYDLEAARWQALHHARLRSRGQTPPWRDAQIAATAASQDLILVTRNTADFVSYDELKLENWFEK
jgi:predicted nucleic acid-binding protein